MSALLDCALRVWQRSWRVLFVCGKGGKLAELSIIADGFAFESWRNLVNKKSTPFHGSDITIHARLLCLMEVRVMS